MKLLVTILYSYSNENAITSQTIEFNSTEDRRSAANQIENAYRGKIGYQVTMVFL